MTVEIECRSGESYAAAVYGHVSDMAYDEYLIQDVLGTHQMTVDRFMCDIVTDCAAERLAARLEHDVWEPDVSIFEGYVDAVGTLGAQTREGYLACEDCGRILADVGDALDRLFVRGRVAILGEHLYLTESPGHVEMWLHLPLPKGGFASRDNPDQAFNVAWNAADRPALARALVRDARKEVHGKRLALSLDDVRTAAKEAHRRLGRPEDDGGTPPLAPSMAREPRR